MNELIIMGICAFVIGLMCFVVDFIEDGGIRKICRRLRKIVRGIGEWWFDVVTAYYKYKTMRRRKARR